jgi:hypothetical protein
MSVRRDSLFPQLLLFWHLEKGEVCRTSSTSVCCHIKAQYNFFSVSCKAGVESAMEITRSETGLHANALARGLSKKRLLTFTQSHTDTLLWEARLLELFCTAAAQGT